MNIAGVLNIARMSFSIAQEPLLLFDRLKQRRIVFASFMDNLLWGLYGPVVY
ncbi:hypothetical protein HF282_16430 [Acidithiobacillus ferrooxidans]|nr:hypothetical protein [Acidithiobacillus ferrooxidans]